MYIICAAGGWCPPFIYSSLELTCGLHPATRPGLVLLRGTDTRNQQSMLAPTGVAFSGGGSRAYVAALGQLQALSEAGLIDNVDHVAGVSGGAWAVAARANCDETLELLAPSELNWDALGFLPATKDAPHLAVCRNSMIAVGALALARGRNPYEAWRTAVHSTFLKPFGLSDGAGLELLAGRSAEQTSHSYVPHVGVAVLGEATKAPFTLSRRAFACLELTAGGGRLIGPRGEAPAGRPAAARPAAIPAPRGGRWRRTATSSKGSSSSQLEAGIDFARCSLADALAMSSFFPAAPLQTRYEEGALAAPLLGRLRRALGRSWRVTLPASGLGGGEQIENVPAGEATAEEAKAEAAAAADEASAAADEAMLLGDGGSVCNIPIHVLLAHGVRSSLCLINVGEALPTREEWDPFESELPPPGVPFCEDLAALFGLEPTSPNPSKDLSHAWCFERSSFAPLIAALQSSLAAGRGAFATTTLRTVHNQYWGIAAGESCSVAWGYIARAPTWEAQLPESVRAALGTDYAEAAEVGLDAAAATPEPSTAARSGAPAQAAGAARRRVASLLGDASRASALRYVRALVADVWPRRALDSFPQFPLTRIRLSAAEANALYQQSGWVVAEHADELSAVLGDTEKADNDK